MAVRQRSKKATLQLRLYVVGDAPNSVRAIVNTRAICEKWFVGRYELEIVDMVKFPHRAMADGIIVTPTLIRLAPPPVQRLIGNLSDMDRVLTALGAQ